MFFDFFVLCNLSLAGQDTSTQKVSLNLPVGYLALRELASVSFVSSVVKAFGFGFRRFR